MTKITISNFLNGNITINKLQQKFPDDYEKLVRVVSQFEKKVEELCLTNGSSSTELYSNIEKDLKDRVRITLPYLNEITIEKLTEQVLADWILRCPIDFE